MSLTSTSQPSSSGTRGSALAADEVSLVLARIKAETVAARTEGALVLGCDSVLELDGDVHGKPVDAAEATARWRRMRGREGVLHTGHWIIDTRDGGKGATFGAVASRSSGSPTSATPRSRPTSRPGSRCGGRGVHSRRAGRGLRRGVDGDPHGVVGLSLPLLRDLLAQVGVTWTDLWP